MQPSDLRCEYRVSPVGLDVPRPRFSWILDAGPGAPRGIVQVAYQVVVSTSRDRAAAGTGDTWDSGRVESERSSHVIYDGPPLRSHETYHWNVRVWTNVAGASAWSDVEPAWWVAGIMNPGDWRAAWIGAPGGTHRAVEVRSTTKPAPQRVLRGPPSPMLRVEFELAAAPVKAILYATALGEHEVRLNGRRVGDGLLQPGWTDYHCRVQYQAHDVTGLVHHGMNAIGAMLADGWYAGLLGPGDAVRQHYWGKERRFSCQLLAWDVSGAVTVVATDGSWRCHGDGPVRDADHFLGEVHDARKEQPGWDAPGFDDASWEPVIVDERVRPRLLAQRDEPVRAFATLSPVAITEPAPGVYIADMGQNMVGWCETDVDGQAGDEIVLRHGEMLEEDGTLHVDNLRLAAQVDRFVHDGRGRRTFHPRFTFHGFRFVEISGLRGRPDPSSIRGIAISSITTLASAFSCSNPMLDRLWSNIAWTARDNMVSIPTDCPQRDERMGWMGDAQVFVKTATFLADVAGFMSKFTVDMRDAQGEDGQYADFCPHPFPEHVTFVFSPGWADCGIILPWQVHVAYGDTRILEEHYESMKRYVDLIHEENPGLVWTHYGGNYGDWLNGDTIKAAGYPATGGEIPKNAFATAFFARSAGLLARVARLLGKDTDADRYGKLAAAVKAKFNEQFVDEHGIIAGNTQAGYAIALGFDLLPEGARAGAARRMVDAIAAYDGRISTGFISTIQMLLQLSRLGYHDLACQLVESRRFPSWGYTIDQGATTIWERWDGYVKGRGFQDKGMNSFNHYSIGAVGEWLFSTLLGIDFDEDAPGMKHVIIKPLPGGSITWAKGHLDAMHGRIAVAWRVNDAGGFELDVDIPANTTASIHLPAKDVGSITEGGVPVEQAPGIAVEQGAGGVVVACAGSGSYRLACKG